MTDDDARITDLEIKVAYQEKMISDLDLVVREQAVRVDALEALVRRLQEAVVKAGDKGGEEVLGAHPEEDPVPRSG